VHADFTILFLASLRLLSRLINKQNGVLRPPPLLQLRCHSLKFYTEKNSLKCCRFSKFNNVTADGNVSTVKVFLRYYSISNNYTSPSNSSLSSLVQLDYYCANQKTALGKDR
jgi:hypothetical protein